jgi:hypothetical protein
MLGGGGYGRRRRAAFRWGEGLFRHVAFGEQNLLDAVPVQVLEFTRGILVLSTTLNEHHASLPSTPRKTTPAISKLLLSS